MSKFIRQHLPVTIDFELFFSETNDSDLLLHHPFLRDALSTHYTDKLHGRTEEWDKVLKDVPQITSLRHSFNTDTITLTLPSTSTVDLELFRAQLKSLMPWRKGPFNLLGVDIDTEWRSDWKWNRLLPHITPLKDRNTLDIGTGNGYFLYRMLGEGAKIALGIDPTRLFLYQFQLVQNLLPKNNAHLLPLRGEQLPAFNYFDTVFSMGVLYHRRSPIEHIAELLGFARDGGEIVLETLVVPGDESTILVPQDRYAKMSNVWFLPSTQALENLLKRAGLVNVRTVDVTTTSIEEQRRTDWMDFHSLSDFLDPRNPALTAEGYPAPCRAIVIGNKQG
jgi:tRNA (mo5U34)-methyltransferase